MVYVDSAGIWFGRMKMSHLMADTKEELHAMADKIGVHRRWFQNGSTPHYDICESKKKLALDLGAVPADRGKVIELIQKWRGHGSN
jgi:hypothetical protein